MATKEEFELPTATVKVRADMTEFEESLGTFGVPLAVRIARWIECVLLAAILWRVW